MIYEPKYQSQLSSNDVLNVFFLCFTEPTNINKAECKFYKILSFLYSHSIRCQLVMNNAFRRVNLCNGTDHGLLKFTNYSQITVRVPINFYQFSEINSGFKDLKSIECAKLAWQLPAPADD